MLKIFTVLVLCLLACFTLILLLTVRGIASTSCGQQLEDCDEFKAVCATAEGEHQFFYSQCAMVRENCMTGANWKRDHFSHCNVEMKP